MGKGVQIQSDNGHQTFDEENAIAYTDVKLYSSVPKIYIMLLTSVTSIKKDKCKKVYNYLNVQEQKKIKIHQSIFI